MNGLLYTAFLVCSLLAAQADFQTEFVKGLQALNARDLATAQSSLQAASRLQPANARVWIALAQTWLKAGKPALAADAAGKAQKFGAEDPLVLRTLATYYAEQGKFAKAGDLEALYSAKVPSDSGAVSRAMADWLQGDQPKKAIALALAAPGWEGRAELRNLLGKAYEADGQILKTIPELQEAIRLRPDDEAFYFDLMQALLSHFNFEAAIVAGEAGQLRFPRSAQLALSTGVAYYGQDRQDAAIEAFLRATTLDSPGEQPYLFLARLLRQAGDRLPAIAARFDDFAQKNPGNALGYFLQAKALTAGPGEPARAESLLREAIRLESGYWESHYDLGILLASRHAWAEAETEFRRSVELNPNDPTTHYRLFRALAAQGKTREAEAELAVQRTVAARHQSDLDRVTGAVKRLDLGSARAPR